MAIRKTTSEFIAAANQKHGEKYDYTVSSYQGNRIKIKIRCKEHGIFEIYPKHHLYQKQGCPECSKKNYTTDEFIKKCIDKHGDKYDYSLVQYIDIYTKIKIVCKRHGVFDQTPNNHLNMLHQCPVCAYDNKTLTKEQYIQRAIEVHGNKYDYSEIIYQHNKTDIKIICPVHGVFHQKPNTHLSGCGCKKCGRINQRLNHIALINYNKNNGYQISPNYNPNGCELLDQIANENGTMIQHAMNGGEYYIKELGYWVDGYDQENNLVYEFDEKHHFDRNGNLKEKDQTRQHEIEHLLTCKFIRMKI